jgi:Fic family protein
LKHEQIRLDVLSLLFEKHGKESSAIIAAWLKSTPTSAYARRAGFFFEFLTGMEVDYTPPKNIAYVPAINPDEYFAASGVNEKKFFIRNNLPGNRQFCPIVRKTETLQQFIKEGLGDLLAVKISEYDPKILERAASYLYLKETRGSFEIENEKPSPDRAARFAQLLSMAKRSSPITEGMLLQVQNAIIDPRFAESAYRVEQNWVGDEIGYFKRVAFIPPRHQDVPSLMEGLIKFSREMSLSGLDPVVSAAALSFGFVFIHPFKDGNGRIHRYLIHQSLTNSGFTPEGIILPVSAVILSSIKSYVSTLEAFSKSLLSVASFNPDIDNEASGNHAAYYRYFDATVQAEFLYRAIERTVTHDLDEEIDYLIRFDAAKNHLNQLFDWPKNSLDLFVNLLMQNDGKLSSSKRKSHFEFMKDDEVSSMEEAFSEAILNLNAFHGLEND